MKMKVTLTLECGCVRSYEQTHYDTLPSYGEDVACTLHGWQIITKATRRGK